MTRLPLLLPALIASLCVIATVEAAPARTEGYQVMRRFPVGGEGGWDYLNIDTRHHHLFVSRGNRVSVVDTVSGTLIGTIADTPGVHGIAVAPNLGRGFISNGLGASVTVFDLDTLKNIGTIQGTGEKPDAIVYDAPSGHVLTFNGKSHDVSIIDPRAGKVIATLPLPGKPEFAVSDGQGQVFANIEDISALVRIDTVHPRITAQWPLQPCRAPSGLAMDSAHHRLFSVYDNRTMVVTDSTNGRVVAALPIGDGPDAVAFDAGEGTIYSANGESGNITVIHEDDADHYAIKATLPTQVSARTLTLDAKSHRLYLSAAQVGQKQAGPSRPLPLPDSFQVLEVGQP